MGIFKSFILSIHFLTIFTFSKKLVCNEKELSLSQIFFPLVGLFIGIILAYTYFLLSSVFPALLTSLIIVCIFIILTGALHLDGLADTIDGFYAGKDKESILIIMHDSHIGTMGALVAFCCILLKIVLIFSFIDEIRYKALILMPVLGRWGMSFGIFCFKYARSEGKGKVFFSYKSITKIMVSTIITMFILYAVLGISGLFLIIIAAAIALFVGFQTSIKLGGITGDVLGAMNEIIEIIILFSLYFYNI